MGLNRIRETKEGQCVRSGACKQNFYDVILSGLHTHNYQEPNLGETVSGEEERGNLACVGAAWVQLGEGSCPQREIETGYFWACPPVPSLTYNHASSTPFTISAHPSPSATAGPSCTVPIRTFEFMVSCLTLTDGRREVGGSLRLSYHTGLQKKMAASLVVPWFLLCAIVLELECARAAAGWETRAWTVCNGISLLY